MTRKVEEFKARAEDGRTFTIFKYQPHVPAHTLDDPDDTIPGLPYLQTAAGRTVNRCGNGTYEIVGLGLKVRKIS